MPNIASILKDEISRVARKVLRSELGPLRKASTQHRKDLAELKRQMGELKREVSFLRKQEKKRIEGGAESADEPEESSGANRFSPAGVKTHRGRLGVSAAAYGKLVGVSGLTVYNWENGKSRPRQKQLRALAAVRGMGKREATKRLDLV